MFSRDAAEDLFGVLRMNGIGFDVELLFIAKRRGYKIKEVPITWYYDSYSTMKLWDRLSQDAKENSGNPS